MRITQGTVICNARSSKYPEIECHGIIITARCDLAQEKTDKVFYLIGIPFTKWIYSNSGFTNITSAKVASLLNNIKNDISSFGLCYEDLFSFSDSEIQTVIESTITDKQTKRRIFEKIQTYKHITSDKLTLEEKKKIIHENAKDISDYVSKISNGANSHFILIPKTEFNSCIDDYGLIIDLQELDYLQYEWLEPLRSGRFDVQERSINQEKKNLFDSKFFINSGSGYAFPCCEIKSPWIEYIMQHFSNLFIRIGVDSLEKDDIKQAIIDISMLEEEK